jgi:creatinine amidohydrolase
MVIKISALFAVALGVAMPVVAKPLPSVWMDDYTTTELKARIVTGCPVVMIFSGGTEETGPYVALGKHGARVKAYAASIARNLGDALVAPILHYAPNGGVLDTFPGTISLKPETFFAVNEEVARSLLNTGFPRVALLSDHGGGQKQLADLAAKLDAEYAAKGARVFFVSDGYRRARSEIEASIKASGHVAGGHGGLWDTAETMATAPELVRPGPYQPGPSDNDGNGAYNAAGIGGDPRAASAKLGREYGALRVKLATDELATALKNAGPCRK